MFSCPRCTGRLNNALQPGRVEFLCRTCHGRMLGSSLVRQFTDAQTFRALWDRAAIEAADGALACPACAHPMRCVHVPDVVEPFEIDVCIRCHVFWLDQTERARLTGAIVPSAETDRPSVSAFQRIELQETVDEPLDFGTSNPYVRLAHHLGAPVDHDSAKVRLPLGTIFMAAALLLGSLVALSPSVGDTLGFIPAAPLRLFGLTLILSPIVAESLTAGLINTFFFVYLADNLEQFLGTARLLVLVGLSAMAGIAGQWIHHADPEGILLGSDPTITALAVMFGLSFYRMHLNLLLGLYRPWHVLALPAWVVIILWTFVAIMDMFSGLQGHTLGAHAGASGVAAALWWTFHERMPQPAD